MQVLKFVFILLEVLLLFNLLIFVHELGHFLAARWRGLKIDRFAIWFGKPIWQKEINGVVYCLGSIPAGGYVALPQMASMDTIEGKSDSPAEQLPPISTMDKIIVAFAGPLFSFSLALVFAVLVWGIGRPVSETETTTTIGYVVTNSPAAKAGLLPGDEIVKVDGHTVHRFSGIGDTVMWRIVRSEGEVIPITVKRGGQELNVEVRPTREKTEVWERKSLRQIQVAALQTPIIARLDPHGPAARAGLKRNDIVVAVNGTNIYSPEAVADELRQGNGKPVTLTIRRDKEQFQKSITPVMPDSLLNDTNVPAQLKFPRLGVEWEMGGLMAVDNPDPISQIKTSVTGMLSTLGAIVSKKSDIGLQHLSGPVGIVRIYYRLFESEQGWRLAIWFSVVLNVNLALLNLLPIPVLDGGHITLAIIEGIRRRPVNVKIIGAVQTSCAVLIIGYMLFVTFFDAQDWRPWRRQPKAPEIKFNPPSDAPAPR